MSFKIKSILLFLFFTISFSSYSQQVKKGISHMGILNTPFSFKMLPLFNIHLFYDYQFSDKWGIQGDVSFEMGTNNYIDGTALGLFNVLSIAPKYYIHDNRISKRGHLKQLFLSAALLGQWDTGKRLAGSSFDTYAERRVFPFQAYIAPQLTYRHVGKKGFIYQVLASYPIGLYTPDHTPTDQDLYQKEGMEIRFNLGYMFF
ncbi:hypothetical protein [Flammeovirga sp. SJP92]|uniref:hypothetical protein n=1 Tax=Flammeovirga sp. SJP92 TaxID=1775430 RepID=UPI0007885FB0|nr:hypothetical protein [Flammeovirga sp. SJP92]KXX71671.1 hypothetical protein AVL50_05200 [Flammeovirga sp. SJP92]